MNKSRAILPTSCLFALSLLLSWPANAMQQQVLLPEAMDLSDTEQTEAIAIGMKEIVLEAQLENGKLMHQTAGEIMHYLEARLPQLINNPALRTAQNIFEVDTRSYELGRLASSIEGLPESLAQAFRHRLVKSRFFSKVTALRENTNDVVEAAGQEMSPAEYMRLAIMKTLRAFQHNPPTTLEDRIWWVQQVKRLRHFFKLHVQNDQNITPVTKTELRNGILMLHTLASRN